MSPRQTLFVALLTAIYLCFELAFNARLLDVVGGAASNEQIHSIETFGRALSGVAVALLVLQFLLSMRNRLGTGSPDAFAVAEHVKVVVASIMQPTAFYRPWTARPC